LILNVILSFIKFTAGIIGSSQAIIADAVHSISDTSTDLIILIGVKYWSAPADEDHPHGHQRIETAITILIGLLLVIVAIGLIYDALITISGASTHRPGWIAFWAAIISIISKESIYRWTVSVGKRIKSSAVIANAWHHRSDAFSSIPAALAVAGARIDPHWYFLDQIGAVVVSFFIFQAAWKISWPALKQIVDTGSSREDIMLIEKITLETDGVKSVHAIRTRHIGSGIEVDLHIEVKATLTVRAGHGISAEVKRRLLREGPNLVDVVVHLEPFEENDIPR
jgi:cation diffusion facilitator family transporter